MEIMNLIKWNQYKEIYKNATVCARFEEDEYGL